MSAVTTRVGSLALLVMLLPSLSAQSASWSPLVTQVPPVAAGWDSARQLTVMITYAAGVHHWQWDGTAAERRVTADPNVVNIAWLGDDAAQGRLLAIAPPQIGAWDGVRWSWQTPAFAPDINYLMQFTFDARRRRIVAFDGATNDVHEWDGSQWWSTSGTPGPVARNDAAFAYDPVAQQCVLYGGSDSSGPLGDCWRWDGSLWTNVALQSQPGPRSGAAMAFDPGVGSLVLYGGSAATTTWRLVGNAWAQVATLHVPGPRTNALLVRDPQGMLLVGGSGDPLGTAWRFTGTDWIAVANFAAPVWRTLAGIAMDRVRDQAVLFGGGAPTAHPTVVFDTQWRGTTPTIEPPPRNNPLMCWSSTDQRVLLFGGIDASNTTLSDSWSWTGSNWVQHNTPLSPPPRVGATCAEDPAGGVLLFGGRVGTTNLGDHWHWNGVLWSSVTPGTLPPPSSTAQAALDPIGNRVLLVDPQTFLSSQTWMWDGATWVQAAGNPQILFSGPRCIAFDPKRGRLVTQSYPSFEWTGTGWNPLPQNLQLPGHVVGLVDDRSRQRLLAVTMFSGMEVSQLTDHAASVAPFGYGCAIGPSPVLHALQDPIPGNPHFALEVATVTPAVPAFLVLGFSAQNQPFGGGCSLLVGQQIATVFLPGSPAAQSRFPLPIPNDPGLRGVQLVAQGAVLDALRSPIGSVTATAALRIIIGD